MSMRQGAPYCLAGAKKELEDLYAWYRLIKGPITGSTGEPILEKIYEEREN